MDPLEYEDTPDWEVAKQAVIKEEKSNAINIIATMKKLIQWGEKMGFGDSAFEQLFLQFSKHELKEGLAGISRFSGDVDKVFEAIAWYQKGLDQTSKWKKDSGEKTTKT